MNDSTPLNFFRGSTNHRSLHDLIESTVNNQKIDRLFHWISSNNKLGSALFCHKSQLFQFNAEVFLPVLLYSSSDKRGTLETIARKKSQQITKGLFQKLDQNQLLKTDLFEGVGDFALHYLIRFIRNSPELLELVNAKNFDYKLQKEKLGNNSSLNVQGFIQDMEKDWNENGFFE